MSRRAKVVAGVTILLALAASAVLLLQNANLSLSDVRVKQNGDHAVVLTLLFGDYASGVSSIEIHDKGGTLIWEVAATDPTGTFQLASFDLNAGANSSSLIHPLAGHVAVKHPTGSEFTLERGKKYKVTVCFGQWICPKVKIEFKG